MRKKCTFDGCNNLSYSAKYCKKHYLAIENKEKSCCIEKCEYTHYRKGYCRKHYNQVNMFGRVCEIDYAKTEIIEYENFGEIVYFDIDGLEVCRSQFDLDDINIINNKRWVIDNGGYVACSIYNTLHRAVMGNPVKELGVIDHIDKNRLNNRKDNLRLCTVQENARNSKVYITNKSGTKGVHFDKKEKKWIARIYSDYKTIHLGSFKTLEEAIRAKAKRETARNSIL